MPDAVGRLHAASKGRYTVDRQIGEGRIAAVYLADDLKHERKVAMRAMRSVWSSAVTSQEEGDSRETAGADSAPPAPSALRLHRPRSPPRSETKVTVSPSGANRAHRSSP